MRLFPITRSPIMTRITGKTPANTTVTKIPSANPASAALNVVVNIHHGKVSPAQKQAWKMFYQKLIVEVKKETDK